MLNDADAAGLAEMTFGEGRGERGTVLMLTFGTGIGSALFVDGVLVPNTELGHLEMHGKDAEQRASDRAREEHDLAGRVGRAGAGVPAGTWRCCSRPSLIIIGGGVSKKADKFLPHLHLDTPVVPAELENEAGIVGAARAAARSPGQPDSDSAMSES